MAQTKVDPRPKRVPRHSRRSAEAEKMNGRAPLPSRYGCWASRLARLTEARSDRFARYVRHEVLQAGVDCPIAVAFILCGRRRWSI